MTLTLTHAFWLFPLVALPGLWLTWRLYARPRGEQGSRRGVLRLLTVTATAVWMLLSWLVVAPVLRTQSDVYHPPVVVLALDESLSHAALGARDSSRRLLVVAQQHYEAQGFKVLRASFAERVVASGAEAGLLSRPSVLRRHLDSLAIPNLQAIVIATDGRFVEAAESIGAWPAPVFPLQVVPPTGEVQGESVTIRAGDAEDGLDVEFSWSLIGGDSDAVVAELWGGARRVWQETLRAPEGTSPGSRATQRFRLPTPAQPEFFDKGFALVRPAAMEDNTHAINDTVRITWRGRGRPRQIVAGPLASLKERGLIDALSQTDSFAVSVENPAALRPAPGDLVWANVRAREHGQVMARARSAGASRVEYHAPAASGSAFGADARIAWRADGAEFLSAAVLRLGDLGADSLVLPAPRPEVEVLAWVEQGDRKGMLLWRDRADGDYGVVLLPLWRAAFRADGGIPVAAGRAWTRAAARWMTAEGTARVVFPESLLADRPFTAMAHVPHVAGEAENAARTVLVDSSGGRSFTGRATGRGVVRLDSLSFPAGRHAVRLLHDGAVVWSGVLHARAARDIALSRLGTDAEMLSLLAAASRGSVVRVHAGNGENPVAWPILPGGQVREERAHVIPLAPLVPFVLVVAILLCFLWWLRKRSRLD